MIGYRLFWLLKTEGYLYLVTEWQKEACAVHMTASKPKKAKRVLDLAIDPDQSFLLYERKEGGILWTRELPVSRDETGKLRVDITDLLREANVPFTFCEPGTFRHYKASTYELWRRMDFFSLGWKGTREGFAYDSPASATFSFFPESLCICGAWIHEITLSGFEWSPQKLDKYISSVQAPCHMDRDTARRLLEEQGPLSKLTITSDRIRLAAGMFFLSSFRVEGFGRNWRYLLHSDMFQENGCAPCKTHRLGPLLCMLLEAADEAAVEQALQWAVEADILKK